MSDFVTLVNRTDGVLEGLYDGRTHLIPPGKQEIEKFKAIKFVEQNPVMGSEDPRTGRMIYKLGIPELRMDCSPLKPVDLAPFKGSIEKWDRTKLAGARPSEVVPGDNGIYSGRDVSTALPRDSSFVDNTR